MKVIRKCKRKKENQESLVRKALSEGIIEYGLDSRIGKTKVKKGNTEETKKKSFSYPKDYILQEEELPFDFKYYQDLKETEMEQYLDSNPGYANIEHGKGEGPKKTYCGVLSSVEKASPVVICAFKMHSAEELEKFKGKPDAMEVFKEKSLFLDNDEEVFMSIVVDKTIVNSKNYPEEKNWIEVVNELGDIIEEKTDLNRISYVSEEDKKKAKEHMERALNHLEEVKQIAKSDDIESEMKTPQINSEISQAASLSRKSVELNPKNPELWAERGNIYLSLDDIEGSKGIAVTCYKNTLMLDPNNKLYQEKLEKAKEIKNN